MSLSKELYFDATKVQANASLDSVKPRFAVDEHLRNLFEETDEESQESNNKQTEHEQTPENPAPEQLCKDVPFDLAEHNSYRHDWVAEGGQPQREVRRHRYHRVADYQMSTTDPDAASDGG